MRRLRFSILFAAVLVLGSAPAYALPEVWVGQSNGYDIVRFDFDRTILGDFSAVERVDAIEVVGDEVWVGGNARKTIRRFDFDGTLIDSFSSILAIGEIRVIPEPSTALLIATGLAGLAAAGRRRS